MSVLLRLFPREWRERYGTEFQALLDDVPLTPSVGLDIARNAVAVHLRSATRSRHAGAWASHAADERAVWIGAVAAMVGGGLWAGIIATGAMVEWGRYGRDLGFLLLMVGAIPLLVAQIRLVSIDAASAHQGWRGLVRLLTLAAGTMLAAALVAAIIGEPPLGVRLPVGPRALWTGGMLAMVAGSGIVALILVDLPGMSRLSSGVIAVTGWVLGLALFVDLGPSAAPALVGTGAMQMAVGESGWFVTTPLVVLAGILFGVAWCVTGCRGLIGNTRTGVAPAPR